ncbi:hypothetical protein Acor_43120 [Acrocarpospora corrugata]|uniref:Uncharacterized protein n=1 Tax=Acrocarpospora corrugata TaxID=35763 RepID=A0A5M3VZE8_9ACTN|nr:hypothetical protein Acor_43120 [Acrocarpospora corrugata]
MAGIGQWDDFGDQTGSRGRDPGQPDRVAGTRVRECGQMLWAEDLPCQACDHGDDAEEDEGGKEAQAEGGHCLDSDFSGCGGGGGAGGVAGVVGEAGEDVGYGCSAVYCSGHCAGQGGQGAFFG